MRFLGNSGSPQIERIGDKLGDLQSARITADYELADLAAENQQTALANAKLAAKLVHDLKVHISEPRDAKLIGKTINAWKKENNFR